MSSKVNGQPPLALHSKEGTGAVSISNYRKALRHYLTEEDIATKDKWVQRAAKVPIYKTQQGVTRYLLFLASHDSVPDDKEDGMIAPGRPGTMEVLTLDNWKGSSPMTVEHIAPQRNNRSWQQTIYDDPEVVDQLGNLTLLPRLENSILANRSWDHQYLGKQVMGP
jgi:hypothetical protein